MDKVFPVFETTWKALLIHLFTILGLHSKINSPHITAGTVSLETTHVHSNDS